jgi:hypothetical protein
MHCIELSGGFFLALAHVALIRAGSIAARHAPIFIHGLARHSQRKTVAAPSVEFQAKHLRLP